MDNDEDLHEEMMNMRFLSNVMTAMAFLSLITGLIIMLTALLNGEPETGWNGMGYTLGGVIAWLLARYTGSRSIHMQSEIQRADRQKEQPNG